MHAYPIQRHACLLIEGNIQAAIRITADKNDPDIPPKIRKTLQQTPITDVILNTQHTEWKENLQDNDIIQLNLMANDIPFEVINTFDGTIETIYAHELKNPIRKTVLGKELTIIHPEHKPRLFGAYRDMYELEDEFHENMKSLLPEDFPIRAYIVDIKGIAYE